VTRTRVCAGTRRRCGAAGSTWMSVRRRPGDSTRDPGSDSRCRHAAVASRRLDDGRRVQLQTRSTQVYSAAGPDRLRNRSAVYINMLAVSGGTGGGRTGPVRLGSGTGVKINSRERRAERTLIWVFLAFVVLWLPFFCANFDCKPSSRLLFLASMCKHDVVHKTESRLRLSQRRHSRTEPRP